MKRWLRVIGFNLGLFLAGILILELIFGGWLDTSRLNRLYLLKDVHLERDVSALYHDGSPLIHYSRDSQGLRGRYGSPAGIDILTVGGSATDQRYIDDSRTWQEMLRAELERKGLSLTVVNAGVDGQSTYGHIKNFEYWFPLIPGLAPRFVLFYVGVNDFHIDKHSFYDDFEGEDRTLRRRVRYIYRKNSALYNLYRAMKETFQAMAVQQLSHRAIDFASLSWTREPLQTDYGFLEPRLIAYAERLRELVRLTRDMGASAILVSQPSRWYRMSPDGPEGVSEETSYDGRPINGVDRYNIMRRFDQVAHSVAAESAVPFVDLDGDPGWQDADFYDYAHNTPQGARRIGSLLAAALADMLAAPGSGQADKGAARALSHAP